MATYRDHGPRPAIATFFGITSFVWALILLGWVLLVIAVAAVIGVGSWLGGPVIGAVGTAVGGLIALYCVLSSLLSFVLLVAGWRILVGDPRGLPLLRLWAWASLVFDVLSLLLSGGLSGTSYFGVAYAVAVLYFTTPQALESRWTMADGYAYPGSKPKMPIDPDF